MKNKRDYLILTILGVLIGVAMQLASHLPGHWGTNFIALMSGDLGCWAVITILISSSSKTFLQSGYRCFLFNVGMVLGYYYMAPYSATFVSNYKWFVIAILMFPIGMLVYWYKSNILVLSSIIIFFLVSIGLDIASFIQIVENNRISAYSPNGEVIFIQQTWFSLGNNIAIMIFSLLGIIFMLLNYQKRTS